MAAEFWASVSAAVAAWVWTPAVTVTSSGTAVTTPWPVVVTSRGGMRVAAGRSRLADAGDCRGGDDDRGGKRDEKEASHDPSTPLRGFLSHVHYRFADCRWSLDDPESGRRAYLEGHIPGAVYLDVERDLSAPPGLAGRHPLPDAAAFAAAMGRAGIGRETFVVAYGSMGGAERLWWLLRHFGHDGCGVFDLAAWRGPLTAGEEHAVPAVFEPRARDDDTISREELARRRDELVVVDARLPPVGAASRIPSTGSRAGSRERSTRRGPSRSRSCRPASLPSTAAPGVTACVVLHRLHLAGRDGRLYPGSWSEWEQYPELPVERGLASARFGRELVRRARQGSGRSVANLV